MIFISISLLVIAAFAKAVADTEEESGRKTASSGNKWKHGDRNLGEAFLGSSTIFVAFTDRWHAANLVRHVCYFLLPFTWPGVFKWYLDFLMIWGAHGLAFEYLFYRPLKRK